MDFTLTKYCQLCLAILKAGYTPVTVAQILQTSHLTERLVVLRHDIDRMPASALAMARAEHEMGVCSTYYIRFVRGVYSDKTVRAIAELGHEVGYHYETMAKTGGDVQAAFQLFVRELTEIRKNVRVRTICMHGSPMSTHNNLFLWKEYDYQTLDILGEAYLSLDYSKLAYYTDTGRSWNSSANLRDRPPGDLGKKVCRTTNDLIQVISSQQYRQVCILTHPERWNNHPFMWFFSYGLDSAATVAKTILKLARKTPSLLFFG